MVRYQSNQSIKNKFEQNPLFSRRTDILSTNTVLGTRGKTILRPNMNRIGEITQTKLIQKRKLMVYKKDDKFYIDKSAAYALKLTNVRAIMTEKPRLFEIGIETLYKFQNDKSIEIEYQELDKEKESNLKRKLLVYKKDDKFYIDNSAAYALNITNVRAMMTENPHLVEISLETLYRFQNDENIEIEYQELNKEKETQNDENIEIDRQELDKEGEVQTDGNIEIDHQELDKEREVRTRNVRQVILSTSQQKDKSSTQKTNNVRRIILDDNQRTENFSNTTKNRRTRKILLDACAETKLSDITTAKETLREGLKEQEKNYEEKEI